jgi:pimeloyl-ACP methyl ester carboxylesterase
MLELAKRDPSLAVQAAAAQDVDLIRTLTERPEALLDDYEPPSGDRWFFEDPSRRRVFLDAVREGVRQGAEACAWEAIDVWLPWGFRLAEITSEIHVWHGAEDTIVDRVHVDFLVDALPNARLTVWQDSGHQGIARHWGEVLEAVAVPAARG